VLPLRATQKIQTMLAGFTPPSSGFEPPAGLVLPGFTTLPDLTAAALSLRLKVASHGYLAEVRRQIHRALCPACNLENIAVPSPSWP
jgi:hypothetical protein